MLASHIREREFVPFHRELPRRLGRPTRLASLLLLAGSVRPSAFHAAIHRQLIDLPIDMTCTLLDVWQAQAAQLAEASGLDRLLIRVLLDKATPSDPPALSRIDPALISIERDSVELRGTGGLLRDVALNAGDPDDYLLVTNLSQLIVRPLPQIMENVAESKADVVVVNQRDGTPTGLIFVRRRCLELVPEVGFVDLKEQALATIAQRYHVAVLPQGGPVGLPIRTLAGYIKALRWHHMSGAGYDVGVFAEEWSPAFSLVEEGALVGEGAEILDSVVLSGGRVEAGAVVARSVVCPEGVVRSGRTVTDTLVTGTRQVNRLIRREGGH